MYLLFNALRLLLRLSCQLVRCKHTSSISVYTGILELHMLIHMKKLYLFCEGNFLSSDIHSPYSSRALKMENEDRMSGYCSGRRTFSCLFVSFTLTFSVRSYVSVAGISFNRGTNFNVKTYRDSVIPFVCVCVTRYSDSQRAGRSSNRIPVGTRFSAPFRPARGPPSHLYNGYQVFPGGKAAGPWRRPPTPTSAEVKERVVLYLYSPSGPL
jgi:hypothetical protein